jgi:hypothetical protein
MKQYGYSKGKPMMTGDDVCRIQAAVGVDVDGEFGPATRDAVAAYQKKHGLKVSGLVGPHTWTFIVKDVPRSDEDHTRATIVGHARWAVANANRIHYSQAGDRMAAIHKPRSLPLSTDCSASITLFYSWSGAPDPNGLLYDGEGYTGTMLSHCKRITAAQAKPGDLVVFGDTPGHHVCMVLESGANPTLVSHGMERGPIVIDFHQELEWQEMRPAHWLRVPDWA